MDRFLDGRVVVVTGASKGIGKACAIEAGRRGAKVVVNYRSSQDGAEQAAAAIREAGSEAAVAQADVAREDEVARLFEEARRAFGAVDAVIANAGLQRDDDFLEMSVEDWRRVVDVNLSGQFLTAQAAGRLFRNQGRRRPKGAIGVILFMSSVHDIVPWGGHANYAAAKGGLDMLMRTVAQELGPMGVRALSISPGAIKTDINREVWEDEAQAEELLKLIPYRRIGEPEDVAKAAAWLLSDDADYVTGATLYVDGGMTLYPGFAENG